MFYGPVSVQDCLAESREPVDRGTVLKVVLRYKTSSAQPTHSTSDAWPWHGPKGPHWGKGHHPLWERLCLLSSPPRSLSKACSSGLASGFYTILWKFFNPPGRSKLCIKGDAGCQLSSSLTSLISFFSLSASSFTQKGKLWKENNTWVWVCLLQNAQTPSVGKVVHPPR